MTDLPRQLPLPRGPAIRKWFYFYAPFILICLAITIYLFSRQSPEFYASARSLGGEFHKVTPWHKGLAHMMRFFWEHTLALTGADLKFMFFITYMSMAMTFCPLPTGVLVSFVAAQRGQFVHSDFWNACMVAGFGALATTAANMTDYSLVVLLARHRRIATVRDTRTYKLAARWFAKAPFKIILFFNVIIIPVDISRMLAAVYGYSRVRFAAANFVGRFIRYASIVGVTVLLGAEHDWIGPVAFLAITVIIAVAKLLPRLWRRPAARVPLDTQGDAR